MKTVVLAYHTIGCRGIEALLRNGFEVAAVFTHKDDPDENIWFESVAELAASRNIPVYAPEDINHPLWVKKIRRSPPIFGKKRAVEVQASGRRDIQYGGPDKIAVVKGENNVGCNLPDLPNPKGVVDILRGIDRDVPVSS